MMKAMLVVLVLGVATTGCFPSAMAGPEDGAGGSHLGGGRGGLTAPDRCVGETGTIEYQQNCRLQTQASKARR